MSRGREDAPPPGHPIAVDLGCLCPIVDNNHGRGSYKGRYIVSDRCPLHDITDMEDMNGDPDPDR